MPADERPPFALNPPRARRRDKRFDVLSFEIVPPQVVSPDPHYYALPHSVLLCVDGEPICTLLNDENGAIPVAYFVGPALARSSTWSKRYRRPPRVQLTCCGCGQDGCGSTVGRLRRLKHRVVVDQLRCGAHRTDEVFTFEPAQFDRTLQSLWKAIEALPGVGDWVW